ncbi:PQQ-dependent sugar dehydrogenase [Microbacterium sp. P05]|uniref:PQQ-dependent sugar dehydrogenase n=1 Tax=Microbacterium sp. P05 TaxID=3366948 RepID=UPI0037472A76
MTSPRTLPAIVVAVAFISALAGCTATQTPAVTPTATAVSESPEPSSGMRVPVGTPTEVTSGLDVPWSVVFAGTTPLISERDSGRILELDDAGQSREVGQVAGVQPRGEGGLLGLAIQDGNALFAYSSGQRGNRVERYDLQGTAGSFSLGPPETIIDDLPSSSYHNGGRLAFGSDGMLYASIGDTGDRSSAQDVTALSGKILRVAPDGTIPSDNPFPDSPVYSYGHRNVQGLGWAADGTMFASEFGEDTWDELNIIVPGGNYGWPAVEGTGENNDFINPAQVWAPANASPSGIAIVDDTVFIANLRGEVLRAVPVSEPDTFVDYFAGEYGRLRAVAPAPDGTLWLVTSNTDGPGSAGADDDRIVSVELSAPE